MNKKIIKKSPSQMKLMRQAGKVASNTLLAVAERITPGITTEDLNQFVHLDTIKQGATPAPLNYQGFPKSICTSRNEVVCHGIPKDNEFLEEGDIINIDLTSLYQGYHGDTSATFFVGKPSAEAKHLVEVAREALTRGIQAARCGSTFGDIGAAIQDFTREEGCTVIERFDGHGIGEHFHEPPWVNHYGMKGSGNTIEEGMTFTIEPVIVLGSQEVQLLEDGWTMITKDGSLAAQFEHTVAITTLGTEILTDRSNKLANCELI
ncbi:type I methionyl aminopeptidase [Rubritalea spongiae]|uniref:Methionine aminopeptidase n=1 Tax=Rubritalea spongiae TaxID=430797 RepID=A0ABW5DZM8_9BACT